MLPTAHLFQEEVPASAIRAALKQAAVWGTGGILAAKLGQSDQKKNLTKEEKLKARKSMVTQGLAGAAAGAAGALV